MIFFASGTLVDPPSTGWAALRLHEVTTESALWLGDFDAWKSPKGALRVDSVPLGSGFDDC